MRKIIISCHEDTVWRKPKIWEDANYYYGSLDNLICCKALNNVHSDLSKVKDLKICFTKDEETTMNGAKQIAKQHYNSRNNLYIITLDITEEGKNYDMQLENVFGLDSSKLSKIFIPRQCGVLPYGGIDESWVYGAKGFQCLSYCLPIEPVGKYFDGFRHKINKTKVSKNKVEIYEDGLIKLVNYLANKYDK